MNKELASEKLIYSILNSWSGFLSLVEVLLLILCRLIGLNGYAGSKVLWFYVDFLVITIHDDTVMEIEIWHKCENKQ